MNQNNQIGPSLFFCVNGKLLFHYTNLKHSEKYGDFYNYPYSHFQIWMKYYEEKYKVDFDFYPRGRVVYRITDDTYLIYFDPCMEKYINKVVSKYSDKKIELCHDEHYQCHQCNEDYIL